MASVRDQSQQDRRVYVGNLSYDVKWHHLKDFMRQGETPRLQILCNLWLTIPQLVRCYSPMCYFFRTECRRWAYDLAGFPGFMVFIGHWIDGRTLCPGENRDAGESLLPSLVCDPG